MRDSAWKGYAAVFLVLASVVISGALILPRFSNRPAPEIPAAAKKNPPASAFVEQTADADPVAEAAYNYTSSFSRLIGDGLIGINPEGPTAAGAEPPDLNAVATQLLIEVAANGELATLAVEASPLSAAAYAPEEVPANPPAIAKYRGELDRLFAKLNSPEALNAIARPPTPTAVNAIQILLEETAVEIERLAVPKNLIPLHLATLRLLQQEIDFLANVSNPGSDPLKAALRFELQARTLPILVGEFRAELAAAQNIFAATGNPASAFSLSLFALPTAHAQWVVNDPALLAERLIEWAKEMAVDFVKDQLIHRMVQQVVTWIQGGGQPQFITNWKGFLRDASNLAAGSVIEKIAPQLCQSFGPLVRISLLPVNLPSYPVTCTLDQVVANVQDFYNDFNQGGWIAYGAALQPQNNYLGALIQVSDIADREAAKAQAAAQAEAQAGQGFLGQQDCVKHVWVDVPGSAGTLPSRQLKCEEYKTTTPGATQASILGQSIEAPLHRIVNAKDITALVSALINAGLTKLVDIGTKGLLGLTASQTPTTTVDPCEGTCGQARNTCKQRTCGRLTGSAKQSCDQAVAAGDAKCVQTNSVCDSWETPLDSPNASAGDTAATPGFYCDNDSTLTTFSAPASIRLVCQGSSGWAGITANQSNCNQRPDLGTPGWTFDASGNAYDVNGSAVSFIDKVACPGQKYVNVLAGSYNVVAWGQSPNTAAYACGPGGPGASPTHLECQANACTLASGPGASTCQTDADCNLPPTGPQHTECQGNSCIRLPGQGSNQCATSRQCLGLPNTEPGLVATSTSGWNGDLANNPSNNSWLVVSQKTDGSGIEGRIMDNNGQPLTPPFTVSDTPPTLFHGAPRAVYSPDQGRYLVVWEHELAANGSLNELAGRFVDAAGVPQGASFVLTPELTTGVNRLSLSSNLRYDSGQRKFVLAWERRPAAGEVDIYLKTLSNAGAPSPAVKIAETAGLFEGSPDVAVNSRKGEYCVIYQRDSGGNLSEIVLRAVDAATLAPLPPTSAASSTFGYAQLAYNSQDDQYLGVWANGRDNTVTDGRLYALCDGRSGGPVRTIRQGILSTRLEYNPANNIYGLIGTETQDLSNTFIALQADLTEIISYNLFLTAQQGNFAPTLAPNLWNGTFAGASSRDYADYLFAPDLGGVLLRFR